MWSVLLLIAVVVLFLYKLHYVPKGFPPGPWGIPILGYLPFLGKKAHLTFAQLAKKYGSITGYKIGNYHVVILNDLQSIREVFKDERFNRRPDIELYDIWGGYGDKTHNRYGVFLSDSEEWYVQRRFTVKQLKDFGLGGRGLEGILEEELVQLTAALRKDIVDCEDIDVCDRVALAVINVIWMLINGERRSYDDPEVKAMSHELINNVMDVVYPGAFYLMPQLVRLFPKQFCMRWEDSVNPVAKHRKLVRKQVDEHVRTYKPEVIRHFADMYINEIKSTTDPKSSFYGEHGRVHTITPAIQWTFLYLCTHGDQMERIRKEINSVVGRSRLPSMEDRKIMPYTEAVINETLRLSSVSPLGDLRSAATDVRYGGYLIPKGTVVIGNIYAVMHDPEIWEKPEEFLPERFLTEDGKFKKESALVPFGVGKRSCIGESLSRMFMFYFLTGIFQQFEVSIPDNAERPSLESSGGILLFPKPFKMNIKQKVD